MRRIIGRGERIKKTHHEKILVLEGKEIDIDFINRNIIKLEKACQSGSNAEIISILKELVP